MKMAINSKSSEQDFAGVIIERKDGKMLFQLRDNKKSIPNPNKWWIFGGGINPNETPIDAAVRELKEEINLHIEKKDLKLIKKKQLKTRKVYIYKLKLYRKMPKLKLKEGQKMKFMSKDEILKKDNVVSTLRKFLPI